MTCSRKKKVFILNFLFHLFVFLCTFLYFCFTISWRPTTEGSEGGDKPTNLPVDKMMIQYFRWRCELLDNGPIQDEFSKDSWKWWKIWDGYYDLYGEMIQLPRWMGVWYNQQLTVVKQKCKEFVKVTIQWNCLGLFSRKFKVFVFNFLFHVLFFFAHSCIFVSLFPDDQPQKEWRWWWTNEPANWKNGDPVLQMEMWATWEQSNPRWIQWR